MKRALLVHRGKQYPLGSATTVIGRDATCEVVIDDEKISGEHAAILRERDRWVLVDLRSSNGVVVVGVGPVQHHLLEHGDRIRLVDEELRFECVALKKRAEAKAPAPRPNPAAVEAPLVAALADLADMLAMAKGGELPAEALELVKAAAGATGVEAGGDDARRVFAEAAEALIALAISCRG